MRFILAIFLLLNLCFGAILSVNDAFKLTQGQDNSGVFVQIDLGNEIFLYKKELQVLLNGKNVTNLLKLPQAKNINGEERFYQSLRLHFSTYMLSKELAQLQSPASLVLSYQGCSNAGFCYRPLKAIFKLENVQNHFQITPLSINSTKETSALSKEFKSEFKNDDLSAEFNKGFFLTLLSFFIYGLLLSLTPCTLPMIPILSSLIITKGGQSASKAYNVFLCFIFVLFMSLAYALAGLFSAFLGASVQIFLQKPAVLIGFALIFVLLALSCFGVFSFKMPFQNALNKLNFKGSGILIIPIMGFLSALIVGPCTAAPLAAALLYIANSADVVLGASALFVLSLGMGAPLLLIGLGIGFLKQGAWMKKVNFIFAFLLLSVAIYFISRLLPEAFKLVSYGVLGVFFVSFLGLFESLNSAQNINVTRFKKALLTLILAYSLALFLGGLFGGKELLNPLNLSISSNLGKSESTLFFKEIKNLKDLKAEIKNSQKPIMLEFTAAWCVNCKVLEESVFKDECVLERLKDFNLLRADITKGSDKELEIIKEFQAFAPPVLLFFDKGGQVLRIDGLISAQEFLTKINKI